MLAHTGLVITPYIQAAPYIAQMVIQPLRCTLLDAWPQVLMEVSVCPQDPCKATETTVASLVMFSTYSQLSSELRPEGQALGVLGLPF